MSSWKNIVFLKSVDDIKKLKHSEGSDIQVHGSGKQLFSEGAIAAAFTLTDSFVTPNGVIFANYKRAGKVRTDTVGA